MKDKEDNANKWEMKVYVRNPLFVSDLVERWKDKYIAGIKLTEDVILNLIQHKEIMCYRFSHYAFHRGEKKFVGIPEEYFDACDISEIAHTHFVCLDLIDDYEVSNMVSYRPGAKDIERPFAYHRLSQYEEIIEKQRHRIVLLEEVVKNLEEENDMLRQENSNLANDDALGGGSARVFNELLYAWLVTSFDAGPFVRDKAGKLQLNKKLTNWLIEKIQLAGLSISQPTASKYLKGVLNQVAKEKLK